MSTVFEPNAAPAHAGAGAGARAVSPGNMPGARAEETIEISRLRALWTTIKRKPLGAASAVLIAGLVILVGYQTLDIRRHPLEPLPLPMNRNTGQPQRPNGEVITVAAG